MIRGLYSAASALVAGLFRQELIAQDLANINTPGYKAASTRLSDFATMLLARLPAGIGPATPLGRLTHGVQTSAALTDFSPGPVQATGQPLDLAIQGEGFFRLRTPDGERFTRDGRFSLDVNGQLVNVNGYPVLGTNGQPIRLSSGQVRVDPNGTIYLNDQPAGQIGLAVFADPAASLQRSENGLFAAVGAAPTGGAGGTIQQGYVEMANVDPATTMTHMLAVMRAYQAAQRIIQIEDEMLGRAVNDVGRVP